MALPTWMLATLASAFLQNLRSALQKHLKTHMGTTAATFCRFGFGLPFAGLYAGLVFGVTGLALPTPTAAFFGWVSLGAVAQIAATFLLVHLFSYRSFAVGSAYARTEPAMAVGWSALFLGETGSPTTLAAVALSVAGVMLVSVARTPLTLGTLARSALQPNARIGIASGAAFGLCSVSVRCASLSLDGGAPPMSRAIFTLVVILTLQTLAMLAWLAWREPGELAKIGRAWKPAVGTGFVGASASFGWFLAMSLTAVPAVKALGQTEILLSIGSGALWFREHVNRLELIGCLLVGAGAVALVLGR